MKLVIQNKLLHLVGRYLVKCMALLLFACSLLYLYMYIFRRFNLNFPVYGYYVAGAVLFLVAGIWLHRERKIPINLLQVFIFWFRLYLAYVMAFYIIPKFFSLQFVVPTDVLNQKAGELSGFWKAWLFYAHSHTYTSIIAGAEAVAALLLLFNRTYITGSLLYTFMLGIILPMNYLYGVETMQLPVVTYLLTALFIIATHGRRVLHFMIGRSFGCIGPQQQQLRWLALLYLPLAFLVIRDVIFFYKVARAL